MDPLSGGSRHRRLPPTFAGRVFHRPRRGCLIQRAGVTTAIAAVALIAFVARAAAATYHARNGAQLQAAVAGADAGSGASTIELSGGVFLPTSTLTISRNVTIVGPSSAPAAKLGGSAIEPFPSDLLRVEAHAKLTVWNVELTAGGGAGSAAAIDDDGAVDLESSTVAGNDGPGIWVQPGATATVRNSTLSGGLDFGVVDDGTASLLDSTVAENANGGIDDPAGALRLTNTIVAANHSSDCTRPAAASDRSLDSDGSCGVGALSRADPLLGRLTNNGGPTPTQALVAGSPAIGAGDDANCPAEDQRHFARPRGRCDIGAYQTNAVPGGGSAGSLGSGSGSPITSGGAARGLAGVSGHGTLRGSRRSRIAFSVRAQLGRSRASFVYVDRARHVTLKALTLRSIVIDGTRGVATLRGSGVELPSRRRVNVTIVLVSHSRHRSMRIRLSNGYADSGAILSGSITFTLSPGQ
jgi:hypothetical protein